MPSGLKSGDYVGSSGRNVHRALMGASIRQHVSISAYPVQVDMPIQWHQGWWDTSRERLKQVFFWRWCRQICTAWARVWRLRIAIEQHEGALSMFASDFARWPRESMITSEMINFHHGYHHDSCCFYVYWVYSGQLLLTPSGLVMSKLSSPTSDMTFLFWSTS